jgi:4'-phosphopantetheinyl transferase
MTGGLGLPDGEIHLWHADLDAAEASYGALLGTLASDEAERAARFRFERDRRSFAVCRSALREILGAYLGRPPAALCFEYAPTGKPSLARQAATSDSSLSFNVSHSGGLAAIAVSRAAELGVDIEVERADLELETIARRFFAPGEVEALLAHPPSERQGAFYRCWTRKEAYLKARGTGIVAGLDRFEVTLAPGEAALRRTLDDPAEAARWRLYDCPPARGFAGAVAATGLPQRIVKRRWPVDLKSEA